LRLAAEDRLRLGVLQLHWNLIACVLPAGR